MSKYLLFILYFTSAVNAFCQKQSFQGTYAYGGKTQESSAGYLQIHYGKNGSILFYLEVFRGAPSLNSGAKYGRAILDNKTGHLLYTPKDTTEDCSLEFIKNKNVITVKTIKGDCPFGYGVYADGSYLLNNKSNPVFFIDRHESKIYFDRTSPEKYEE